MIEAGDSMEMIEKYRAAIKRGGPSHGGSLRESRLSVCQDCEKLNAGTCMACGCYVELRAAAAVSTLSEEEVVVAAVSAARRSGSRRTAVVGET